MRIYKFRINTENLKEEDHDLMDCRFSDLLGNVEDHLAVVYNDNPIVTTYLYTEDQSIVNGFFDILFDFGTFYDMKEITQDVLTDFKQFEQIDSNYDKNHDLLYNFLLENIDSNFVLDYIEKNGKEKFENDILEFIPKFFDKI